MQCGHTYQAGPSAPTYHSPPFARSATRSWLLAVVVLFAATFGGVSYVRHVRSIRLQEADRLASEGAQQQAEQENRRVAAIEEAERKEREARDRLAVLQEKARRQEKAAEKIQRESTYSGGSSRGVPASPFGQGAPIQSRPKEDVPMAWRCSLCGEELHFNWGGDSSWRPPSGTCRENGGQDHNWRRVR